jgi:hypothetical protein
MTVRDPEPRAVLYLDARKSGFFCRTAAHPPIAHCRNANLKSLGFFCKDIYVYTYTYIESYANDLLFYIFVMLFSIFLGTNDFISGPHIR